MGNILFNFTAQRKEKNELARLKPSVGFEIDGKYKLLTSKTACGYSAQFQSVVENGILSVVNDTVRCNNITILFSFGYYLKHHSSSTFIYLRIFEKEKPC